MSELVPVSFHKIMQSRSYTVIILEAEGKKFAIYTEPQVGNSIQVHLAKTALPRPATIDLMNAILMGLNVSVLQIVLNHIEDTIYFARLFLEQTIGTESQILEIDARPSDCMTLALMHNIPVFCKSDVLEKAVAIS